MKLAKWGVLCEGYHPSLNNIGEGDLGCIGTESTVEWGYSTVYTRKTSVGNPSRGGKLTRAMMAQSVGWAKCRDIESYSGNPGSGNGED